MRICTIVARNYLAYARVLAESFLIQEPTGECVVLVIDDIDHEVDDTSEPFRVLRPEDLKLERFGAMAGMYDVTELATAVKPWLLEQLLTSGDGHPVAYFDPDIRFYAPVTEIEQRAAENELVLTPHITAPLPDDGKQPGELDLMASGIYNLGFVAMAPSTRTLELLAWWQKRLRYDCVIDHALGYFVDQRWFDLVPNTFAGTAILRDPGMNVAYWNLHERIVSRDQDGSWQINGKPLRFFHFSGFDPDEPHLLSKHQTRTYLSAEPELALLCKEFADEVRAHRRPGEKIPYAWSKLGDGRVWDRRLRRLYREGERVGAFQLSPFDPAGAKEFIDWLNEPALEAATPIPISRFWFDVYRERKDLQAVFPDLIKDVAEFMRWIDGFGHEMGDVHDLMPTSNNLHVAAPASADVAAEPVEEEPLGVNVAGFLQSELGIGEAARGLIAGLDAARVPVLPLHGAWRPSSRQEHSYAMFDTAGAAFPINIVCVNADVLSDWAAQAGEAFFSDRYTIGFWWWEVLDFPPEWQDAFGLVDEIWVASQHVADALMPVSSVPITKITMPVGAPAFASSRRSELGLPEGFLFLFLFDHHSIFERKNPLGVIEAFKQAFAPDSGASLVIKSINHDHHPDEHERLLLAANEHPDIHIIDNYVSAQVKNSMIASADCYVSLHRAEGFGLTMAEAMCLGKPVIATRFGGNLEFMDDRNSWLVDCEMMPIGPGHSPYPANGKWADPDLNQAARWMREVSSDSDAAQERALRGARHMSSAHSPKQAAPLMRSRLEHIHSRRAHWPRRSNTEIARLDVGRLHELLERGPQPPLRSPLGPFGRLLRRIVLRLIKPFAAHQQMVDAELSGIVTSLIDGAAESRAARVAGSRRQARETATQLAELRRQAQSVESAVSELERLRTDVERVRPPTSPAPFDASSQAESEPDLDVERPRFARRAT
jgi:glycosyltransferase involved in cell wall biosynthesis